MRLADVKVMLRVSTDAFDAEIEQLMECAREDLLRVGIREEAIEAEGALVRQAIVCYCKAHFGYDEPNAAEFDRSYRLLVGDLLNSPANSAARTRR